MNCLIDGQPGDRISVRDRGLAYGDGVFRTLACEAGRLLAWSRHYRKLAADCAALGLDCPSEACLLDDLARLAPQTATVKIIVTRGAAARGYACDPQAASTRIVQTAPPPAYPASWQLQGVEVGLCTWPLSIQPGLAGIKHLNRLDQVMARREWTDGARFDGLMCNPRGELVEGVISNLFVLIDGRLHTHPLLDCGVAGVARSIVLELAARLTLDVVLVPLHAADLSRAEAVLLSNSLAGILPVARCGQLHWQDFALARQLNAHYRDLILQESHPCISALP